jgi:hypothetical protein
MHRIRYFVLALGLTCAPMAQTVTLRGRVTAAGALAGAFSIGA